MAEQARDVGQQVGQAAKAAAQPALEVMAEFAMEAAKCWGRAYLRINNPWVAAIAVGGVVIGTFYTANKALTMLAIRRAVERRDPDNPDQPADPQVGLEAEVDSLLVPVYFYSQLGYQYFTTILNGPFLKACLQTELEKVGYKEAINVSVENWELPNLPEGMMREERVVSYLAQLPEKMSKLSTAALGDSGIPEDVFSEAAGTSVTTQEDVEEETRPSGPEQQQPGEKKGPRRWLSARLKKSLDPAQVPGTSQQTELQEGPLKGLRARLQQHQDSPTAQTWLKAYSCLERGAVMLTSGGYQEGEGVEHLLEGFVLMEMVSRSNVRTFLYDRLHLNKEKLDQLISKQLHANPDSTPCLLIHALQLPYGHSRQQAINHVIDVVLQHGETDPMYKQLADIYCALGYTIWQATKQHTPALSAFASALMYKSDHLLTLFLTAMCSMDVSVPQAIRQFHYYIHTAPTCHDWVPDAHYHLVTLYGRQDPSVHRDRILHHYNMAQETDRNRLPGFSPVLSKLTDRARKVYEQVTAQT